MNYPSQLFLLWVANILNPIVIIAKAVRITTIANVVYFLWQCSHRLSFSRNSRIFKPW